jgi:hypothetical protein
MARAGPAVDRSSAFSDRSPPALDCPDGSRLTPGWAIPIVLSMRHLIHRRAGRVAVSILLAAAVWLATLHLCFSAAPDAISESLATTQLALWEETTRGGRTRIQVLHERLRASNRSGT